MTQVYKAIYLPWHEQSSSLYLDKYHDNTHLGHGETYAGLFQAPKTVKNVFEY